MIASALVAGAAAGLKPSAEQAVKDAYAQFKRLLRSRFGSVDVARPERDPSPESAKQAVEEELRGAGAAADPDVVAAARQLLDLLQRHAPEALRTAGVVLEDVEGGNLAVEDVLGYDQGVTVKRARLGDIQIRGIGRRAPGEAGNPPTQ